jgi:RNA ligase
MKPQPYPRTPYLNETPAGFLDGPLRVEEKLDGANVALWRVDHDVEVMSRGGPGAMDRGRQLGRLRAWVRERHDAVRQLTDDGTVIYAEWLWRTHTVRYDALPDWLAVLDLWRDGEWLDPQARDERVTRAGLCIPPLLSPALVIPDAEAARRLIGASTWGGEPAEGLVLRRPDGGRAKIVRDGYRQSDDAAWSGPARHNRLRTREPA